MEYPEDRSNRSLGCTGSYPEDEPNTGFDFLTMGVHLFPEHINKMIKRVAPSDANVLITGESGTGKETLAREIHDESKRNLKPYVCINCGSLRETLLDSEIFGHEKGAFTGAYTRKIGLVQVASGGTLVLQNIHELPPGLQAKVLRMLQEGDIYRVGGKDPIKVDVRLITTSTDNLNRLVLTGHFREDLFYRMNTIHMNSIPLRAMTSNLKELIENLFPHFTKSVSGSAMVALSEYSWPGNFREFENIFVALEVMTVGESVMLEDLPERIRNPSSKSDEIQYDSSITLYDLEKHYILKALNHYEGNKTQAAQALGITVKTLYNKLHEFGEFEKYSIKS